MKDLFGYMIRDFYHPINYLPKAVGTAFLILAAIWLGKIVFSHSRILRWMFNKSGVIFLFSIYCYVLLYEAFFSRPPGSRNTVSMTLFQTWGTTAQSHAYVIENVLMFIPYGIFISMLAGWNRVKKGGLCILTALLSSSALEFVQWMTMRGHCQMDDVVMNTLGAGIGWGIYAVIFYLGKWRE